MGFQMRCSGSWEPWKSRDVDTLLLDLDGTLFRTFRVHWRAYRAALKELGSAYQLPWQDFLEINVKRGEKFEACIPGIDRHSLYSLKTKHFLSALENLRPTLGAKRLVRQFQNVGGRYGIVTGARRDTVDAILKRCWPVPAPDAVVAYDDVVKSKPAPDCYIAAMSILSKTPNQCIAVEDAPSGATSALAAGVKCFVVNSSYFCQNEFPLGVEFLTSLADLRVRND